ncbi:Meiotic recombination protein rec12 [Cladobotryum mycophilum]|uniref:DNA topoisomerase (ATP-hydrolyzing) n=1 Tax=Cladobotryum mycophilum TaxID=491253 RepID=A0ABR0SPV6_9HYPO
MDDDALESNDQDDHGRSRRLTTQSTTAGAVVSRIEDILESILDRMTEAEELSISLVSRKSGHRHPQQIHFPGRNFQEAKKFARILLILQLSHDALVSGTILTKRHIYYQHQDLFEAQRNVDELVDDLALTLDIGRDDLNIVASAKGLFCGPLTIRLHDGSLIDSSLGDAGASLPITRSISHIDYGAIRWILVVEKDAIFRSLTSTRYWQTSTAKGYPDLITLSFLRLVQVNRPQMPILVLVDFDPDGLNIFRCYRFGADLSGQEPDATISSIRLLGIKAGQVLQLQSDTPCLGPLLGDSTPADAQSSIASKTSKNSISSTDCRDPISLLSSRDRKQAVRILEKTASFSAEDHEAPNLDGNFS